MEFAEQDGICFGLFWMLRNLSVEVGFLFLWHWNLKGMFRNSPKSIGYRMSVKAVTRVGTLALHHALELQKHGIGIMLNRVLVIAMAACFGLPVCETVSAQGPAFGGPDGHRQHAQPRTCTALHTFIYVM